MRSTAWRRTMLRARGFDRAGRSLSALPTRTWAARGRSSSLSSSSMRHAVCRRYEERGFAVGEAMGAEFPGHLALVHHVIGYVPAGEASIVIRVQTPHSAAAFEICREYLRRIKSTVPIWKKPVFVGEEVPSPRP